MKRRWIVAAAAVLILGLLAVWVPSRIEWRDVSVPTPLRGEARTNPFYTAERLVAALGARSERRDALGAAPPQDAALFLAHWHWSLIPSRREALERWVESGGRVVIDGTLAGGADELGAWIGVEREYDFVEEDEAIQPQPEPEPIEEEDAASAAEDEEADCWVLETSHGGSELTPPGGRYSVCGMLAGSWFTSQQSPQWALHDGQGLQAVRIGVGRGSVTMLNAIPFDNRDLMRADHARLFADAMQLRRGDLVIFLSEAEHASLLALIWRHGAPVVLIASLLIAAALWRGAVRFGPMAAAPELSRRSLGEQIRGTGQFVMRAGRGKALHAAMVRALDDAGARRIAGYAGLNEPDRIQAMSRATGLDADRLAAALHWAGGRSAQDLKRVVITIEEARQRLLQN